MPTRSKRGYRGQNIILDQPNPPGERWVNIPKSDNNRFWKITLFNRRRGNRKTVGTAACWRLRWLCEAIINRHGPYHMSSRGKSPITFRLGVGGPLVMVVEPLSGPSVDFATKH